MTHYFANTESRVRLTAIVLALFAVMSTVQIACSTESDDGEHTSDALYGRYGRTYGYGN